MTPGLPAQGESGVKGRPPRAPANSGSSAICRRPGANAGFRPQTASWWSPVLWVAPRAPRVAAWCPPPLPQAGPGMRAQFLRPGLAIATGPDTACRRDPAADWTGGFAGPDMKTPKAPKRRWAGRSPQAVFVHVSQPLPGLGLGSMETANSLKPDWRQPAHAVTVSPGRRFGVCAGVAFRSAARVLPGRLPRFVPSSAECKRPPEHGSTVRPWSSATLESPGQRPFAGLAMPLAGNFHPAAACTVRGEMPPAGPWRTVFFSVETRQRVDRAGSGPELAAPASWKLTANPVSFRPVKPMGCVTIGCNMSWPTHALIPPPVSRAGTSAGASTTESLAAGEPWRAAGSGPEEALERSFVQQHSLARWRTSGAMPPGAIPGKRGLAQCRLPARPCSRSGSIPPAAWLEIRIAEELRTGGAARGMSFSCGALRAGLLPLDSPGTVGVLWKAAAGSWRQEESRTEAGPAPASALWRCKVVRFGPLVPGAPDREAGRPVPGRPQRLRLPGLSLRFAELPPPASGRDSAARSAASVPPDASRPAS